MKEHTDAGQGSHVCACTHTHACLGVDTHRRREGLACIGYGDSDSKEAKRMCPLAPQITRQGSVLPSSVCLGGSEAA